VRCERVATKYERSDREVYKLAVLANAWIAELSGDLERARIVLEQLGKERGFETDVDRVLALARVYERLGTPAYLEHAAHIFRFLDRSFEKLSTLGRLAGVYRRLNNRERADEYEERFLTAFRRRMHRVSEADVATVAAWRYLPLAELRRVQLVPVEAIDAENTQSSREHAIRAFLRGALDEARTFFGRGGELLDRKYLADLALVQGDVPGAVASFVEVLRDDPDDPRVLASLLDHAREAHEVLVAEVVGSTELRSRLVANLATSIRDTPLAEAPWRNMATLLRLIGDYPEAERCAERAHALEAAARRDSQTIGRVLAAAVFHFIGKTKGLIHQVWVDRTPTEVGRGGFLASDDILGPSPFPSCPPLFRLSPRPDLDEDGRLPCLAQRASVPSDWCAWDLRPQVRCARLRPDPRCASTRASSASRDRCSPCRRPPLPCCSALASTLPRGRHSARDGCTARGNAAPATAWPLHTVVVAVVALGRRSCDRRGG